LAPVFLELTPYDFYLWESLNVKRIKTYLHTLEDLRNDIHREISTISGQELHRINDVFRRCTWEHLVRKATFSAYATALITYC